MKIKKVKSTEAINIIEGKEPRGLFYYKLKANYYIAIDNRIGCIWTRRFRKYKLMRNWLIGR